VGIAYLCTAEDLHASWMRDYKLPFRSAWALTIVPAFFISILMGNSFVLMASILGTICGGMNGVFVGMMRTALAEQHRQMSMVVLALLIVFIYAFGMTGQITSWLFL
jgi:ABC-type microcin C transport system permease subunit YejE